MVQILWLDLDRVEYGAAFAVQETLYQRCREQGQDILLFQENHPVITLGRSASDEHITAPREQLLRAGIAVRQVSRGGDVTYHGPGQLVISPILHLKEYVRTVHEYVRQLEQVMLNLLTLYGFDGQRIAGASGVWVGEKKVAAIGIAVRHGITQHGMAINVHPDLRHFEYIIPCGIQDKGVTSLQELGAGTLTLEQVRNDFLAEFSRHFGVGLMARTVN
ncbi:MAG TPA: lipoyl(octanoyl) transferase LipB [Patescibacteria group bacterium]|nr:lipoyl(octanoyl) transferase LipB [Patescibacteria group bacterium]